ncbi:hypothetical protein KCX83_14145 [Brucella oryzae]|uniref:hypothetical protein n=1 Tax=Brucella oryzae TaxID=335286 RepID=UPI001B83761E|nr:hypothetical protein [Brucella oryzae]MBR7653461.1 hypothetical protein [Brucella oryzae]
MRHSAPHTAAFPPIEKIAFDELISHLRSAGRFPLRIAMIGTATFIDDDSEAEPISYDRTVRLAECRSLQDAIITAHARIAHDDVEGSAGDIVRFLPRIVTVTDSEGRLVAAGEVCARDIRWCEPVKSDGEARMVVTEASRLRGKAFIESGADNPNTARSLRFSASVLEGRLVDKVWRAPVRAALPQTA